MSKTRKLYAVAPDGTILTRTTHRDYSHAVLCPDRDGSWAVYAFSGRFDLAYKASRTRYAPARTIIVPVSDVKPEA